MNSAALAWSQFRFERKQFWRNPSAAFFNFLLPILFLVLTASAFSGDEDVLEVLVPGIAAMGVVATTFTALAFALTFRRDEGILKRVRGTPMPEGAFLSGLIGSAVLNAVLQVAIIVTLGNVVYGVEWPSTRSCSSASRCSASSASRRSAWRSHMSSRTRTRRPPSRTRSSCR